MARQTFPKAREITTHRVNGLNELLRIFVLDAPGHGGACHEYVILFPMEDSDAAREKNLLRPESDWDHFVLQAQNISEGELSGVSLKISQDNQVAQNISEGELSGVSLKISQDNQVAQIVRFDTSRLDPEVSAEFFEVVSLSFQNGPIKENGVNGISQEALIAVLIDRLEGFQSGQFKCHDNQVALDHLQGARLWLHKRTMDRVARGVEGTTAV